MKKYIFLLFISIFILSINCQDKSDPSWLLLEKGKLAYKNREYGDAIKFFKEAVEKQGTFPEAEVWIGSVYEIEGELDLAEKQYLKAYSERNLLFTLEDQYSILYKLSHLYFIQKKYQQYEEMLLNIIVNDKNFIGTKAESIKVRINILLNSKGFDSVARLYRFEEFFSLQAHIDLAEFYFKSNRFAKAKEHLIHSLIIIFTKSISEIQIYYPDYEYTSSDLFFSIALNKEHIKKYLIQSNAYKNFYYLGVILQSEGQIDSGKNILKNCFFKDAGKWEKLARKQYNK